MSTTDEDWELWGQQDPYFAVLTDERFGRGKLTQEALEDFFRIGREEIGDIISDCRKYLGNISTRATLEFGCGVGRMLIPLSGISERCIGVDISEAMREEAAKNCAKYDCHNIELVRTLDEARARQGRFTFVHSYIVLQHIDAQRGVNIIAALLESLEAGGSAALHVTYGHSKHQGSLGRPSFARRVMRRIRRPLSRLSRRIRGRDPRMEMNVYDINRILFLAQTRGCRAGGFRFTDHSGHLGVILYLKRESS